MGDMMLYRCMGVLLLINTFFLLMFTFLHCDLGADGYGWKWDTERNEKIAELLMVNWFIIFGGCAGLRCLI
jgi:hypothetical protein